VENGFVEEAVLLGVSLSEAAANAFERYRDMILEAAYRFSLTAVREPREIERRHFLESLALGRDLAAAGLLSEEPRRVIDIGSGAGIPGIPLKLAWPQIELTLLESNEKRCRFLREVIAQLSLDRTRVVEGRAEDWGREPSLRESYDLATARAVAPLAVLVEYALVFLKNGGYLAAPKGSAAPRELEQAKAAIRELGGELVSAGPFRPPRGRPQTLIIVRKVATTPERYPRRPGVAAKRPIA
jgi:16S rRNA (guanine527-N7)-methyltransferase